MSAPWHLKLKRAGACPEALAWVATQLSSEPTLAFEQAWQRCERSDWMAWLVNRSEREREGCLWWRLLDFAPALQFGLLRPNADDLVALRTFATSAEVAAAFERWEP